MHRVSFSECEQRVPKDLLGRNTQVNLNLTVSYGIKVDRNSMTTIILDQTFAVPPQLRSSLVAPNLREIADDELLQAMKADDGWVIAHWLRRGWNPTHVMAEKMLTELSSATKLRYGIDDLIDCAVVVPALQRFDLFESTLFGRYQREDMPELAKLTLRHGVQPTEWELYRACRWGPIELARLVLSTTTYQHQALEEIRDMILVMVFPDREERLALLDESLRRS